MSASASNTAIYLTDSPREIKDKINKYAFSGGRDTAEEQRKYGANLEIDISYQYLTFLLEDDAELAEIGEKYASGQMLTGEIKAKLIEVSTQLVLNHQAARRAVDESTVDEFMSVRHLQFKL